MAHSFYRSPELRSLALSCVGLSPIWGWPSAKIRPTREVCFSFSACLGVHFSLLLAGTRVHAACLYRESEA